MVFGVFKQKDGSFIIGYTRNESKLDKPAKRSPPVIAKTWRPNIGKGYSFEMNIHNEDDTEILTLVGFFDTRLHNEDPERKRKRNLKKPFPRGELCGRIAESLKLDEWRLYFTSGKALEEFSAINGMVIRIVDGKVVTEHWLFDSQSKTVTDVMDEPVTDVMDEPVTDVMDEPVVVSWNGKREFESWASTHLRELMDATLAATPPATIRRRKMENLGFYPNPRYENELDLSSKGYETFEQVVGDYPDLGKYKDVNLSRNKFTSFDGCPSIMTKLYLSHNKISSFEECPSIQDLDLSDNMMTSLVGCPDGIVNLDLSGNEITSLVGCPWGIQRLELCKNKIGSFHGCPTKMHTLDLNGNIIESFVDCPNTKFLNLTDNRIESFDNCNSRIYALDLSGNPIMAFEIPYPNNILNMFEFN